MNDFGRFYTMTFRVILDNILYYDIFDRFCTTYYTVPLSLDAAATAKDKGRLQRVIRSAEKVIGCNLPSLQVLFASRTLRRAGKIMADPSHPGQKLFESLPSGRRPPSIRTRTSRNKKIFFPSAPSLINKARSPPTL
ncbi:hypothetical protein JOB18_011216 [Solea senegalensis]|uniref:Uncharacterized protein n=1 Tax=Solea senegalensis TaxID=28829 RepID=A0AAV6Q158_SOLSE|nr:hypothetical protein JOB18_011216 [Solea senegalensis]